MPKTLDLERLGMKWSRNSASIYEGRGPLGSVVPPAARMTND